MPGPAPRKVLIVDDERDIVEPIVLRLAAAGVEVATARDGEEGLRLARHFRPDAVLMDLAMPEMDGWQLCRRLREDGGGPPPRMVLMTAWVTKDLERRAQSEGFFRVLVKPFEDADMMAALELAPAPQGPAR